MIEESLSNTDSYDKSLNTFAIVASVASDAAAVWVIFNVNCNLISKRRQKLTLKNMGGEFLRNVFRTDFNLR